MKGPRTTKEGLPLYPSCRRHCVPSTCAASRPGAQQWGRLWRPPDAWQLVWLRQLSAKGSGHPCPFPVGPSPSTVSLPHPVPAHACAHPHTRKLAPMLMPPSTRCGTFCMCAWAMLITWPCIRCLCQALGGRRVESMANWLTTGAPVSP